MCVHVFFILRSYAILFYVLCLSANAAYFYFPSKTRSRFRNLCRKVNSVYETKGNAFKERLWKNNHFPWNSINLRAYTSYIDINYRAILFWPILLALSWVIFAQKSVQTFGVYDFFRIFCSQFVNLDVFILVTKQIVLFHRLIFKNVQ